MSPKQRITSIEVQEKRPKRRSIFLDGEFAVGVDERVVRDLNLRVGQQINEEDLKKIVHREQVSKAKERALTLLDYRPRSRAEIERRLRSAGFEEEVIEETLARLDELGLIDDREFTRGWVNHRLAGKPMGRTRIKWELKQKGVSVDLAEEAVSEIDHDTEHRSALEAARRRWSRDRDEDTGEKKRRLGAYLRRQGFDWETIKSVINELTEETSF